jgi:hypothetical protein
MNPYLQRGHKTAFGLGAMAMTAITLGALVVLPAKSLQDARPPVATVPGEAGTTGSLSCWADTAPVRGDARS